MPITLEEVLEDPIRVGFLLAFSESEYNSEIIRYIMEIGRFRDFLALAKVTWSKYENMNNPWRVIDETVGIMLGEEEVRSIKTLSLSDESKLEICKYTAEIVNTA